MDAPWKIQLLGGLRAERCGQVLTHFRTRKMEMLFAYLACHLHRAHPREQLIELLWPDCELKAGRQNLSQALHLLRRHLEPPGLPAGAVLEADYILIRINPAAVVTDVAAFEAGLQAAAQAPNPQQRLRCLTEAVELYRGELLPGYYADWILSEQKRLAEFYFQALHQLAGHLKQAGDLEQALYYARQQVHADPVREEAHQEVMRLLAALGQPSAALRQYQELEQILQQEVAATPSPATRSLARELAALQGPPRLDAGMASPEARPAGRMAPGSAVLVEEGHRVVTVLFSGTSRSTEPDRRSQPRDAVPLWLRAMKDTLTRYEGRVVQVLDGGALAVFGVPQAHEDDPERAIRAATELRAAAQSLGLQVPIGIHTGRAHVGGATTKGPPAAGVRGSVVRLAAGLRRQAEPDQILVGESTYRLTRRAFEFRRVSLADQESGKPAVAYQVVRPLVHGEKARGIEGLQAELIGRDREMATLKAARSEALQGRGQMVSVIGEAGVGKSRLVAELRAEPGEADGWARKRLRGTSSSSSPLWLEGRCLEMNTAASYWVFIDLFRAFFGWDAEDDEATRAQRVVTCLREMVGRGELSEARYEEIGPALGSLLSLRFRNEWDGWLKSASAEQIKHQIFLAVQDFFVALAKRQPVVLVLEDLHWADSLSMDLISLLMESLGAEDPSSGLPASLSPGLLLLCVYRPEREHPCWHLAAIAERKCPERFTELRLRELSQAQTFRLVESLFTTEDLPASVTDPILNRARGNPFFVEEIVWSLIDSGLVYREEKGWRARAGIETVAVPESVQSVILSRVDRLEAEVRHILQSASVIGRLFPRRLLERVLSCQLPEVSGPGGMGREQRVADGEPGPGPQTLDAPLKSALWELEERRLIYQGRVVPEEEYSFQHVLTQETVYKSLLKPRRAKLHQQVAEGIEEVYGNRIGEHYEALAYHYDRSRADEKAVEYLLKAGEKARRAYLNEAAIGYFERALERLNTERPGGDPDLETAGRDRKQWRLKALEELGQIYDLIGKFTDGEASLWQAIALAEQLELPSAQRVHLYYHLGVSMYLQGRYQEMIEIGHRELALVRDNLESSAGALAYTTLATGYMSTGQWDKWQEYARPLARFILRLPYPEIRFEPFVKLQELCQVYERNLAEAWKWLDALEERASQHRDWFDVCKVYDKKGGVLWQSGDAGSGLPLTKRGVDQLEKLGLRSYAAIYSRYVIEQALYLGDIQTAEEYLDRVRQIARMEGPACFDRYSYLLSGLVACIRGDLESALDALQTAEQLFRDWVSRSDQGWVYWHLGHVHLARQDSEAACRHFQQAIVFAGSDWYAIAAALAGLEEAGGGSEAFRALCRQVQAERSQDLACSVRNGYTRRPLVPVRTPCVQWFLQPAQVRPFGQLIVQDPFAALPAILSPPSAEDRERGRQAEVPVSLSPCPTISPSHTGTWVWRDSFGDCAFALRDGLEIQAANTRDLWWLNLSAPQLLRQVHGDFAIQTVCVPASPHKPVMGGLLLWKDPHNFLRLDRGTRGPHELSFLGCLASRDMLLGRGRLLPHPPASMPRDPVAVLPCERVFLRLERLGRRVNALCSPDGREWLSAGSVEFPVEDPVEVGLCAIGNIDRGIYPGVFPEGTAIRFESFELYQ